MIDISKAFGTSSETISAFFQRPGVGYYIPLYQREYSWDKENIDQLIEDISRGVDALLADDKNSIRFMGTVILVTERDISKINPREKRALPSRIDNVIDGQQRISTIALLSCQLYQRLYQIIQKLPDDIQYDGIREANDSYLTTLLEVFSLDFKRGTPTRKPIIIRGSQDGWTYDGDNNNYQSDVSSYIASFISAINNKNEKNKIEFPTPSKKTLVGKNIARINSLLNDVQKAHESKDNEDFPSAWKILEKISEVDLWNYERPELKTLIENRKNPLLPVESQVCSMVQLFAFCYYLLERCCFTLIEPVSETWAFDMFQSLNATGTPLTALETFKPLVVSVVSSNGGFKDSKSEQYFERVDKLLSPLGSASSKNKLTNEFLTLFALTHDGTKLSTQFSAQRRWLIEKYKLYESVNEKEEFIRRMSDLATYWLNAINFDYTKFSTIPETESVADEDKKQATLCVMYLQEAGHKMANTILSRFYALAIRKEQNAASEFVFACKAVAAFFTLWRSALANTGLDEIYRKLLSKQMSWEKGNSEVNVAALKKYFIEMLVEKGIGTKDDWMNKATNYLRYDNAQKVCKFALFVTSHDTITDKSNPGLMKIGTPGSYQYLEPSIWRSEDFRSIEHVAPQRQKLPDNSQWDSKLYEDDDNFQLIGNLTLLPKDINSSASNKAWIEKWIYYSHLAETDPSNLTDLKSIANKNGINLKENTINLLKNTPHNHHIIPIVELGMTGLWDKAFVNKRTERICNILWERMYKWLN